MDIVSTPDEEAVTHVVFDPDTGRILGRMRHDPGLGDDHDHDHEAAGCHCADDPAVLAAFAEEGTAGKAPPRLLDAPQELPGRLGGLRVDLRSHRLVRLPHLVVDPERTVLEGDGQDTVTVEIRAVDDEGAVAEDFSGEVHVQTGRGKLSARGGTVRLERGRATIRLTSVAETVDAVPLVARATDGSATAARTSLAFE